MTEGTFFFAGPLRAINIGIEVFAENLQAEGIQVVHLDWRPPSGGDTRLAAMLAALEDED